MSIGYNPSIATTGLVLNLDAGNKRSYPGSGTLWSDASTTGGNDGTLVNGPVYSSTNGGYLDFDGVDDYTSSTSTSTTDLTGTMTCECWFKLDATASDWVRVFGKGDSTNRTYGLWYNTGSSILLYQRYGTSNFGVTYSATVNTGVWYQMVGVSNGTAQALYLNGVSVGSLTSGSATFFSSSEGYRVGGANFHTYHNGPISIVRLYNAALTADQVLQNFNATRGRYSI